MMKNYRLWKALKVVVVVIAAVLLFGLATMELWNWLAPGIFGLRSITFVQALGLLVLGKILFGGFHRHGGGGWKRGGRGHWEERWAKMSPEERERFRAGMQGRRGCGWTAPGETVSEQSSK
jgi:hypothetical protein